ncbi:MAG: hypothetical protein K9K67_09870, partial [Bacteriovoracaceae bacterium]|nr:hypothetical protein [Bacteriovoracaceae bacterium]
MLLEVAVKNVERSALKVILMTLLFISIPQSLMAELTPRERIAELSNKASIIEVEAQKLSEYLLENPLPTNASEALKNRYHAQELLLNSMRNRSSNLLKLSARLSEVIKGEPSESEITKVVTILNNVDTELETRPLPTPEFIAVVPQQSRIEVRALPPI